LAQTTSLISVQKNIEWFFGLGLQVIGVIFGARLIVDTGARMIFPFIPQIAQGLDLSVVAFSWLIFVRGIVGISSPFFGYWADRYGRRKIMAVGLFLQGLGALVFLFTRQWWALTPMILFGLSATAFLPAQQAYISDRVSYQRRGRALGAIEFSWAVTSILILPVVGWMLVAYGWLSPFAVVAVLSLVGAVAVWRYLPPVAEHHAQAQLSWLELRHLAAKPNVLAATAVAMLVLTAIACFTTIWGIWLGANFKLEPVTIGLVATGIGLAELLGSGVSSLFIDRIGPRRGGGLGLLLAAAVLFCLPLTQATLFLAITTLIVIALLLEFSVVSLVPLYADQAPEARATIFSLTLFGGAIGWAVGPPLTATIWEQTGLVGVCLVAALAIILALSLMWIFLHQAKT
jgi:predicted MFS family arabinose efflux permease